jgi:hypothetical protein
MGKNEKIRLFFIFFFRPFWAYSGGAIGPRSKNTQKGPCFLFFPHSSPQKPQQNPFFPILPILRQVAETIVGLFFGGERFGLSVSSVKGVEERKLFCPHLQCPPCYCFGEDKFLESNSMRGNLTILKKVGRTQKEQNEQKECKTSTSRGIVPAIYPAPTRIKNCINDSYKSAHENLKQTACFPWVHPYHFFISFLVCP